MPPRNRKYVLDAYAWIEYLAGSKAGEKVKAAIEAEGDGILYVRGRARRGRKQSRQGGRDLGLAYDILVNDSSIIDADEEILKEAGILHVEMRKNVSDFGLADAYVS